MSLRVLESPPAGDGVRSPADHAASLQVGFSQHRERGEIHFLSLEFASSLEAAAEENPQKCAKEVS